MFRSLRFRLPALFLAGILLSGIVATATAARLFQSYERAQSVVELKREAAGIATLYVEQANQSVEKGGQAPTFAASLLERATGDRLFYVGGEPFAGENSGLRRLPQSEVEWSSGRVITFEFKPPGTKRTYLAVAHPVKLGAGPAFGALIVAKPKAELRDRWVRLSERLALAFLVGLGVAAALAWYLSRKITTPVLALSKAADEVALGHYDVEVPDVPGGGEVGHLADRFREMAVRLAESEQLERNFLMSVSHELRTPLTAIRGHVSALSEGLHDDPEQRSVSLDTIALETARLERLVGDVLDLAKLDSRRFTVLREEVDMERLLDRAYTTFAGEAKERSIEYVREVKAAPILTTDGDRVLQIISNLLSNAFRWTPDGGRIELRLAAENGTVSVVVGDTGPGIGPGDRERIFRPFWSRDSSGSGLGLAIASELSHALGGKIVLDSTPGEGSRFELQLPVSADGSR